MKPVIGICANVSPAGDSRRSITPNVELQYIQNSYSEFIRAGGGVPVLLPVGPEDESAEIVTRIDGILLTGGVDIDPEIYGQENTDSNSINPGRDSSEISLIHAARAAHKPIFGICRGLQTLNTAFGGTLFQHIPDHVDDALRHYRTALEPEIFHEVLLNKSSPLNQIFGGEKGIINSSHHQSIGEVGQGLQVIAKATDGVVEAIECPEDYCTIAVQWHPERMLEDSVMVDFAKWFIAKVANS